LQAAAIRDIQRRREEQNSKYRRGIVTDKKTIAWIDKLLDTPLDNFRKYCIWRILVPYFINVRGLSRLETFDAIKTNATPYMG
jgi:hypothetical protein